MTINEILNFIECSFCILLRIMTVLLFLCKSNNIFELYDCYHKKNTKELLFKIITNNK